MGTADRRDKWDNKMDFILSCIGYAVGLGNVWRFPYLCGKSGGAAFLIPYVIMMIFAGLPTCYLELSLGQYCSLTPALLYERMCPVFNGIGMTMVVISAYTGIYYNMIIAWSLRYLWASFTSHLPWKDCDNTWNTDNCLDFKLKKECLATNLTYFAGHCHDWTAPENESIREKAIATLVAYNRTPAKEYLDIRILNKSGGIENMGTPQWELVLALFLAWVLVFLCMIRGVKSSGKVVYFTATFPYVILLILFFRGITLEGAIDGIKFYMIPNTTKLMEGGVWGDAAVQIFFSLSLGGGGLTTLASYNQFHNNLYHDTLIVTIGDLFTSFFSGFVIFPILGFIALKTDRKVADVADEGVGLAFVAYADAVTQIPASPLWAILFFFMLILLGIDSQLVICDVVITAILDVFPKLRPGKYKAAVVGSVCFAEFIVGLTLTCPGGLYVLTLLDNFAGGWPLVLACLVEICMVAWVYGVVRFLGDICLMVGIPFNRRKWFGIRRREVYFFWWLNWVCVSPALLAFVLVFNWVTYKRTTYEDKSPYPLWAEAIGWLITMSTLIWIPIMAICKVVEFKRAGKPMRDLIRPTDNWGPEDPLNATEFVNKAKVATVIYKGGLAEYASSKPPAEIGYPIPVGMSDAGYSNGASSIAYGR